LVFLPLFPQTLNERAAVSWQRAVGSGQRAACSVQRAAGSGQRAAVGIKAQTISQWYEVFIQRMRALWSEQGYEWCLLNT
jgi:hypothetical protein